MAKPDEAEQPAQTPGDAESPSKNESDATIEQAVRNIDKTELAKGDPKKHERTTA